MATFEIAFNKTGINEGEWACNPHDKGGETYCGIARKYWPNWKGWFNIDMAKKKMVNIPDPYTPAKGRKDWIRIFNQKLRQDTILQQYVKDFYYSIWQLNRCSFIEDQMVADWVYDHIVNAGERAKEWVQKACMITIDRKIGIKTIDAINNMHPKNLLQRMRQAAKEHRIKRVKEDPTQMDFLTSWLLRDGFSREEIAKIKKEELT